jgi:serine/threonine protein kinase
MGSLRVSRGEPEGATAVDDDQVVRPAASPSPVGSNDRAPVAERLARLALTSRADRYTAGETVDCGGMGKVERVRDLTLGRFVARKSILPAFAERHGDAAVHRFLDEAEVLARLSHQGIIPIHDVGFDAATGPFLIMRWVRGRTLEELLFLRDEQWNEGRLLEVLVKVCDTMAHAHSRGVVHRDLKPANLMVGRFGEVYIIDWGLAKVTGAAPLSAPVRDDDRDLPGSRPDGAGLTVAGHAIGTPGYMAPEQAAGRLADVGPRSDVYAIGAILYRVLTGWQPYAHAGEPAEPARILERLLHGDPPPVRALRPAADARLAAICARAMSRAIGLRHADALELGNELRAAVRPRLQGGFRQWLRRLLLPWSRRSERRRREADALEQRRWREARPRPPSSPPTEPPLTAVDSERGRLERRLRGLARLSAEGGRYAARQLLGVEGGMFAIERVHDSVLDREVARKVLCTDRLWPGIANDAQREELLARLTRRFLDEVQITAQLDHPAILPIHDLGIDLQGRPFAITPLVELDPDHARKLRAGEPLDFDRALRIVLAAADALAYVHERGVVHMNVNPSSILVTRRNEVYLTDWYEARVHGVGVGAETASPGARSGVALYQDEKLAAGPGTTSPPAPAGELQGGNPWFMSPERLLATGAYGPWTDVYQLGATMFYLLCARAPCDFRNDMRRWAGPGLHDLDYWMRRVELLRMGPPALPPQVWGRVPAPVRQVMASAMMIDPQERYPDCAYMAHDLRWCLDRTSKG